ncbi:MAG: radical SAM protein [Thermoplasmata archaeon]
MSYQRFLGPGFEPFDPLELAKETERIVTRRGPSGVERKYTGFYSVPVYRGIATGYAAGCCLRCVYCWSNWSRDFPERCGEFHGPEEVAQKLFRAAEEGILYSDYWREAIPRVNKLRLSGCEPTIGQEHLLSVLEHVLGSKYQLFILETNGLLIGADPHYARALARFASKLYVRVSLKAATPEGFVQRTGAKGKFFELPFTALRRLLDEGIHARAAAMTDPQVMPSSERSLLIERLSEIDPRYARGELEEEVVDQYDTSIKRLRASADRAFAADLEKKLLEQGRHLEE